VTRHPTFLTECPEGHPNLVNTVKLERMLKLSCDHTTEVLNHVSMPCLETICYPKNHRCRYPVSFHDDRIRRRHNFLRGRRYRAQVYIPVSYMHPGKAVANHRWVRLPASNPARTVPCTSVEREHARSVRCTCM
jgi:hypothetical protein